MDECSKQLVFRYAAFLLVIFVVGCRTPEQHVEDADKEVYGILDEKWDDDFGSMANYKIPVEDVFFIQQVPDG